MIRNDKNCWWNYLNIMRVQTWKFWKVVLETIKGSQIGGFKTQLFSLYQQKAVSNHIQHALNDYNFIASCVMDKLSLQQRHKPINVTILRSLRLTFWLTFTRKNWNRRHTCSWHAIEIGTVYLPEWRRSTLHHSRLFFLAVCLQQQECPKRSTHRIKTPCEECDGKHQISRPINFSAVAFN